MFGSILTNTLYLQQIIQNSLNETFVFTKSINQSKPENDEPVPSGIVCIVVVFDMLIQCKRLPDFASPLNCIVSCKATRNCRWVIVMSSSLCHDSDGDTLSCLPEWEEKDWC